MLVVSLLTAASCGSTHIPVIMYGARLANWPHYTLTNYNQSTNKAIRNNLVPVSMHSICGDYLVQANTDGFWSPLHHHIGGRGERGIYMHRDVT